MTAVDWTELGVIAGLFVASGGYLTRLVHREIDGLRQELVPRLDRLEERYIRHLEQHAGH